jgi:hypothetical protein
VRWERRAGLAPARSFNTRLFEADTADAIAALVAEATEEAKQARARKDRTGRKIAVVKLKAATKRRAAIDAAV